jgi:eukaryotic-like serine/threonine-protein kinase
LAEPLLRACLPVLEQQQPDAWTTFSTQSLLGAALLGQKKYAEAEPLLVQGYEGMKQRVGKMRLHDRVRLTEALERLVQMYEATEQQEQADKWRQERERSKLKEKESGK